MFKERTHILPYIEIIIAATIWGSTGLFVKHVQMDSFMLGFFRTAIPALLLALWFLFVRKNPFRKGSYGPVIAVGGLNALRIVLYFIGFSLTTVSNAVIALYTWPMFGTLCAVLFLKEKFDRTLQLGFLLAVVGVGLILVQNEISLASEHFLGVLAMLGHSAVYGIVFVFFKKISQQYSGMELVFHQNFTPAIMFLLLMPIFGQQFSAYQAGVASIYATLIGLVGFGLFFHGLKKVSAIKSGVLSYLEVVSGIILAMIFLQESLNLHQIIGGTCILVSAWITVMHREDSAQ